MQVRRVVQSLSWLAAALLLAGCGALRGPGGDSSVVLDAPPSKPVTVPAPTKPPPVVETGIASWYGQPFHGRRTANGEIYDMHAMTAAHKTMPLPSYARVRNPANGREVIVRINDRGPFKPGRIIDLSHAAAKRLGIGGVAAVEVTRL